MYLKEIFTILNTVLPSKVFYGINIYDNQSNADMPYIVYQEINRRPIGYHDDVPILYEASIQITLVSKRKDLELEKALEKTLLKSKYNYSLISEYFNSDKSINRVYEIKMEDI